MPVAAESDEMPHWLVATPNGSTSPVLLIDQSEFDYFQTIPVFDIIAALKQRTDSMLDHGRPEQRDTAAQTTMRKPWTTPSVIYRDITETNKTIDVDEYQSGGSQQFGPAS